MDNKNLLVLVIIAVVIIFMVGIIVYSGVFDNKPVKNNTTNNITVKNNNSTNSSVDKVSSKKVLAYKSDGTPMYSQAEVDQYMLGKYGQVNYHIGANGYIDMDEPGYDDAGHRVSSSSSSSGGSQSQDGGQSQDSGVNQMT